MSEIENTEFGRYTLVRLLGRGGMAEVYLGESTGPRNFKKMVAIKRLLPHYAANRRFVRMLLDEARIAAAINHPHVAKVIDLGVTDGQHYIAMEFIDGVDLAAILRTLKTRDEVMPVPVALYIARAISEGLHAAHILCDTDGSLLEVIHRDVSPHNVLLSYQGDVKLIDFGVAKARNNLTETRSGVIKGKLQYMSPEQAKAEPLDARADIFAVGMTLYKMLTGRLPFTGQNEFQIYDQILRKQPPPPSYFVADLPELVDAVVLKALRKERERRFQTCADMAGVLDRALRTVDPAFGAHDLADYLANDLSRDSLVRRAAADEDFASEPQASAPMDSIEAIDDEVVDRLTSMKDSPVALAALSALDTQSMGIVRIETPAPVESAAREPAAATFGPDDPTEALPPLDPSLFEMSRPRTQSVPSASTPAPAVPDLVAPATRLPLATPAPAPPTPSVVRRAPSETSTPSVHTSQLTGLRRRRKLPYVAALLVLGGTAAAVVFALNRHDAPARVRSSGPVTISVRAGVDGDIGVVEVLPTATDAGAGAPPVEPPAPDAASTPGAVADAAIAAASPVDAAPPPSPPDAAPPPPPDAAVAPPPPKPRPKWAYLSVNTLPWAWVYVNGRKLKGHTPVLGARLPPGRYTVKLVTADDRSHSKKFTLRAGQRFTVTHQFK